MRALEELLKDAVAGDPISGVKWTHKSTRKLSQQLKRQGFKIGHVTVARLLKDNQYSLRTNRKRLARTHEPERDRQFRYIARLRRLFLKRGDSVLSVDTKKKELVGNFKNPGRCWRREWRDVLDHDFPSQALGRAIPYGIYDIGRNAGYVRIGTSHETAQFAVAAIRRWWKDVGRSCYPGSRRLLIEADCGGANDSRKWAWKAALQTLADELDLEITVTHYPPGASKWNPIEHRLFSLISKNWAGQPLINYETILKFIRTTKSDSGLRCRACLDETVYATGVTITKEERATINLKPRKVIPKWNYTIRPRQ